MRPARRHSPQTFSSRPHSHLHNQTSFSSHMQITSFSNFLCRQAKNYMLSCVCQARLNRRQILKMKRDDKKTRYTPRDGNRGLKSKFLTVAFDEKTRFILELAAGNQHRTLSSLLNEAVVAYLPSLTFTEFGTTTRLLDIAEELWSPIQAKRFVLRADKLPHTLSFQEAVLWELIQADESLWRTLPNGEFITRDGNADFGIKHEFLRERWDELNLKASEIARQESSNLNGAK
jgi:hypothetical protein